MIIASTNIFAYDDNMQSLPRMKNSFGELSPLEKSARKWWKVIGYDDVL